MRKAVIGAGGSARVAPVRDGAGGRRERPAFGDPLFWVKGPKKGSRESSFAPAALEKVPFRLYRRGGGVVSSGKRTGCFLAVRKDLPF